MGRRGCNYGKLLFLGFSLRSVDIERVFGFGCFGVSFGWAKGGFFEALEADFWRLTFLEVMLWTSLGFLEIGGSSE